MITINYKEVGWHKDLSLANVRRAYAAGADTATINGRLIDEPWENTAITDNDKIILVKKGCALDRDEFWHVTKTNLRSDVFAKLNTATIGIAGLGGLGSHVAFALARVWPAKLIIADFDVVEPSNLNRQQYFMDQIGMLKVDASAANLARINPHLLVEHHAVRLTPQNIPQIYAGCRIIVECFDRADQKQMIVETVLTKMDDVIVVSASGLAGYGRSNDIITRRLSKRHILVGDCVSASGGVDGLMAPRVGLAAHHQANAVIEKILKLSE